MQKDTTLKKIFVGGLPYHTTDESLKEFFKQYGTIEEAVVITDRQTGKSRGYGFVTMARSEEALMAIRDPNPCIDGRKANVNLAVLGAKPRQLPGASANLFNPITNMTLSNAQFYNNPLLNQANLLAYNGLVMPTGQANLAMKNLMMQSSQQQPRGLSPQTLTSSVPGHIGQRASGQQELLFNSYQQTNPASASIQASNNSLIDYLNVIVSNQAGNNGVVQQSSAHGSTSDPNSYSLLGQNNNQLNSLYMLNHANSSLANASLGYNIYSQQQMAVAAAATAANTSAASTTEAILQHHVKQNPNVPISQANSNSSLFDTNAPFPHVNLVSKNPVYQLPVQTQEF